MRRNNHYKGLKNLGYQELLYMGHLFLNHIIVLISKMQPIPSRQDIFLRDD